MPTKLKQFGEEYSSIFQDNSVVAAYGYRAPYPAETKDLLLGLLDRTASPRHVLDVGCGRGEMASMLYQSVDRVDAIDISAAMIKAGKEMPYGADPRIQWILGRVEEVTLNPPYALIVAAASIHWMTWESTLPRFAEVLTPPGFLALVETRKEPSEWDKDISPILARYSMNRDFQPYNMLTIANELESRGLFAQSGILEASPVLFRQSVDEWIESIHATNGFSRDRMGAALSAEVDLQLRATIEQHCPTGEVLQWIGARVVFGKPLAPAAT